MIDEARCNSLGMYECVGEWDMKDLEYIWGARVSLMSLEEGNLKLVQVEMCEISMVCY